MFKKQADSIGAFLTKKIFDQAKVVEIIRAKITLYQKSRKIIPHLRIFQSDQPEGIFYAMNESKIENICGRVIKEELEKYKTVYVGENPDKSYDYDQGRRTFWDLLNRSFSQIAQKRNKKLHEKKYPPEPPHFSDGSAAPGYWKWFYMIVLQKWIQK